MYRFLARPKWIAFTVVVAAAVLLMASLGMWQLRRLDDRQTFNRLVEERIAQPVAAFAVLDETPIAEREWRSVVVTGQYDGETDQVPTAGGYLLVTPFLTTEGSVIYVNRGTVGSAETVPTPPAGDVDLVARFRTAPSTATSVPADALFVERTGSVPDEPALAIPGLPALDDGPHLGYAVQWFIFAICVAVGWVLAVRRSARPGSDEAGSATAGATARARSRAKHQAVPWQDDPAPTVPSGPPQER